ncbi:hypothetical protein EVAR_38359_1 [Eumeta japonica]|uniref:Uncharacterized protein n=1 Tax=Eumeta variegata TaxID=151549 RepID=A0A4C1XVF4_EUMVA|nr:hypothetical protein EVAR_38359_1 [Eumeta japonica]
MQRLKKTALDKDTSFITVPSSGRTSRRVPPENSCVFRTSSAPRKEFERSLVNISDEFRDGRPSTAVNNKIIDVVRRIMELDRHVTYHEIWEFLGIGMS